MTSGITVLLSSKRKDPSSSGSALITFSFNISDKVPESHSLSQAKKIISKETIHHFRESEAQEECTREICPPFCSFNFAPRAKNWRGKMHVWDSRRKRMGEEGQSILCQSWSSSTGGLGQGQSQRIWQLIVSREQKYMVREQHDTIKIPSDTVKGQQNHFMSYHVISNKKEEMWRGLS